MVQSFDDQAIEVVTYPKGTTLFRQGEPGDAAFIVNSGSVGIYREVEGKRVPLATLRKGELFGKMAVIDGSPRMATANAGWRLPSSSTTVSASNNPDQFMVPDGSTRVNGLPSASGNSTMP